MVNGIKVGIWYCNRIMKYLITLINEFGLYFMVFNRIKQLPVIAAEKLQLSFGVPMLITGI